MLIVLLILLVIIAIPVTLIILGAKKKRQKGVPHYGWLACFILGIILAVFAVIIIVSAVVVPTYRRYQQRVNHPAVAIAPAKLKSNV